MDPRFLPTTSSLDRDEDWELYNDDGFVYKRQKRRGRIAVAEETAKPPDPVVEERNRRIRKKKILVKLKRKYGNEMKQWEILSHCLNDMQEKSERFKTTQREKRLIENETTTSSLEGARAFDGEDCFKPLSRIDELMFMAERQEAVINEVSKLCEVAEKICRNETEEINQSFFDFTILSSPTDIMASLCSDQGCSIRI